MKNKNQNSKASGRDALRWLWNAIGNRRSHIGLLLVLQVAMSLCSVGYALLFRDMIDQAVAKHQAGFLCYLGWLIALSLTMLVLREINRTLEENCRATAENLLKRRLFSALLEKEFASVSAVHTGEWMNRLTSDTVVVADGVTQILPHMGGMVVRMIGAFAAIVALEPMFGWLLVPAGLALLVVTKVFRPLLKRLHGEIQSADGAVRVLLQERLDNLLIVASFSQQKRSAELAQARMDGHRKARMRRSFASNVSNFGFSFAMRGMYLAGAAFCGLGIVNGTVSYGTMTAVLQLVGQLQTPISGFSGNLSKWYAMLASAERLMEAELLEDAHKELPLTEDACRKLYREGLAGIRLENVCFHYADPSRNGEDVVIRDLNFHLDKGEFVALVGHSGCGKTTLLKLMLGLYRPDHGKMLLAGREDMDLSAAQRALFAYVPQGNQLMSGTIRQTIAFDDEENMRREGELWQALRIACADGFVSQLPQGLDTSIGEHGSGLSEGQIQRLAVARAIFSQRPILLLDEATSALDAQTEEQMLQNLRDMTDRTVLIVTHRPQACRICDRVADLNGTEKESRAYEQ